jgi:hypothetical protein
MLQQSLPVPQQLPGSFRMIDCDFMALLFMPACRQTGLKNKYVINNSRFPVRSNCGHLWLVFLHIQ